MFKINDNYLKLPGSYLFSTIAKKVAAYIEANPDVTLLSQTSSSIESVSYTHLRAHET